MKLDQILRRYFWAVTGLMVAVVALLHAQALTQVIGFSRLGLDEAQLSAAPPASRAAPSGSGVARTMSADAILSRNPFDHVTGALNKPIVPDEVAAVAPDMSDPFHAPPCEGLKVLVIAASTDPEWSFAALVTGSGAEAKSVLRRRGGDVGGKTVEFISWDRVWLASGSSLCQLEMFKPPEPKGAAAPAAPPPPPPKEGPGAIDPDIQKGVRRISATEFDVDRGVVDKILENQAELMRQARIVPEQENGKMVGIRLFGVRPDTLLGVLGMENGDRLQTINGFDMTSPEKALEAYARLRTADQLVVQVNRRGSNMNLDYNIK
jgi:general secretion pathway protein C